MSDPTQRKLWNDFMIWFRWDWILPWSQVSMLHTIISTIMHFNSTTTKIKSLVTSLSFHALKMTDSSTTNFYCCPHLVFKLYSQFHLLFTIKLSRLVTKPAKWSVRPAKTQISLGIHPVWSESSQCAQWVAKDPLLFHAHSKDSDQTGQMPRLIWVFAGRKCHFVGFVVRQLIVYDQLQQDMAQFPFCLLYFQSVCSSSFSFQTATFLVVHYLSVLSLMLIHLQENLKFLLMVAVTQNRRQKR